jgi:hypothetical protein
MEAKVVAQVYRCLKTARGTDQLINELRGDLSIGLLIGEVVGRGKESWRTF